MTNIEFNFHLLFIFDALKSNYNRAEEPTSRRMATKKQIISAIETYIKKRGFVDFIMKYDFWYVCITQSDTRRKREHKHPADWKVWQANSAKVAREIEKHFLGKGMLGGGGGGNNKAVYVYVY